MLKFIFLLLEQRLLSLPELREVDWFNNQYAPSEEEEVMYAAPAAYLEFLSITDLQTEGRKAQKGTVPFRVHVVTELFTDNDNRFKSAALEHYDIVNLVSKQLLGHSALLSDLPDYAAIQNTPGDQQVYNSVTRTGIIPDHKRSHLMLTVMDFSTVAIDFSAAKVFTKITPANPPEITVALSANLNP
ncbi:MAG: hypothetical protein V4714_14060 [Bacteroidota bacterium]